MTPEPLRLGLLGAPVGHSRSPAMMAAALTSAGLSGRYEAHEVSPASLEETLRGLDAAGFDGLNITVPHKVRVAAWAGLAGLSGAAAALGAVNTLVRRPDGWWGHNTDATGLAEVFADAEVALDRGGVALLGAGGAARGALWAARAVGAGAVTVLVRSAARAEGLARLADTLGLGCEVYAAPGPGLDAALRGCGLVVQCSKGGMTGEDALPGWWVDAVCCSATNARVAELVYAPRETAFLAATARAGLRRIDDVGAHMLVAQGAHAFSLWTGRAPDRRAMFAAAFGV
ncbi:MAG: shikimate dehydrogenase (NADP+) [Myxococcales bacterium]|nr:shikimate dehydrogenase (NADP+) [Myxococcales bacterium]